MQRAHASLLTTNSSLLECDFSYRGLQGCKSGPKRTEGDNVRLHFLALHCPPKQGFRAPCGLLPAHLELSSLLSLFQFVDISVWLFHLVRDPLTVTLYLTSLFQGTWKALPLPLIPIAHLSNSKGEGSSEMPWSALLRVSRRLHSSGTRLHKIGSKSIGRN